MATAYDFSATSLAGAAVELKEFQGSVTLIVNTASQCGFTPQYKGLESLYRKYAPRGFAVLGFPCNQFGAQEPGSSSEISEFCEVNFGVSFPMFEKVEVNGPSAHPLFKFLARSKRGLLGTEAIKWNFTKFLVDRDGEVIKRYAPTTSPEDIAGDIEKLL